MIMFQGVVSHITLLQVLYTHKLALINKHIPNTCIHLWMLQLLLGHVSRTMHMKSWCTCSCHAHMDAQMQGKHLGCYNQHLVCSHMHLPQVPLHEGCPGGTPLAWLAPKTHRRILSDRLNPHHIPKTHAKMSPSSLSSFTKLSTSCALSTHVIPSPNISSQI
jgi:hypothetical protein